MSLNRRWDSQRAGTPLPKEPAPRPSLPPSLPPPAALHRVCLGKAEIRLEEVQGRCPGNYVYSGDAAPGCARTEGKIGLQQGSQ